MMNRNTKQQKISLLVLGVCMLSPTFVFGASSCSIDPFVTKISQGDSATMNVLLISQDAQAPFELTLGDLPSGVGSGFLKKEAIETIGNTKKVPLIVQTERDAQVGSFMISVVYKTSSTNEYVCQFNLEIKKNITSFARSAGEESKTSTAQTVPPNTTKTISSGVVPGITDITKSSTSTSTPNAKTSDQKEIKKIEKNQKFTRRLSLRSTGEDVRSLQKVLKSLKFYPESEIATGYFGPITEMAVKAFQKNNHIEPLGIVGPKTRSVLNKESE